MTTEYRELLISLGEGVNVFDSPFTSDQSRILDLKNLEPSDLRLRAIRGLDGSSVSSVNLLNVFRQYVVRLAYTSYYIAGTSELLWFSNETADWVNVMDLPNSNEPLAMVAWLDVIYVTKLGFPLTKVNFGVSETVDTGDVTLSAKYAIISDGHLMLANVIDNGNRISTRIRWSDVDDPETFRVDTDTEADFFDLDLTDNEITGISKSRGHTYIFTKTSIWRATYIGLPAIYSFEPVTEQLGAIVHDSLVTHNNRIFFIGADNIYALDGIEPAPIGTRVWPLFKERANFNKPIRGTLDIANKRILWFYTLKDSSSKEILILELDTGQFGFNESQGANHLVSSTGVNRGIRMAGFWSSGVHYEPPTSNVDSFLYKDELIGGDWQYFDLPFGHLVAVGDAGLVLNPSDVNLAYDSASTECYVETGDMFLGSGLLKKGLGEIKPLFKGVGSPSVVLSVALRDNLNEALVWEDGRSGELYKHRPARFIRFRLDIVNTASDYVSEVYGIFLRYQHVGKNPSKENFSI